MPPVDAALSLTTAEAAERRAQGLGNVSTDDARRTVGDIVRANVLTRFNAILGSLLVVVLLTREYRDALFGIVLVTNAVVGIGQELRAKRTLDRLAVLSAPTASVLRDGAVQEMEPAELVQGDVVQITSGDQLLVDGVVRTSAGLEVDESLISGESEPVARGPGDLVRSGSFVVAGEGRFEATAVGDDAYAVRLTKEAQRFATTRSELRAGTDVILRIGTWALVPTAALLVVSQLRLGEHVSVSESLRSSVAGVGAMIPEGLILLTNVAFAVGVIRLGRRHALVQELAAVEVLARVDVVCVDKTGTLTDGQLVVDHVEALPDGDEATALAALGAIAASDAHPNTSLRSIGAIAPDPGWALEGRVAFSSARKWSAARFHERGWWLLGAPDVLLAAGDPALARVEEAAGEGFRVLLLARADGNDDEPRAETAAPIALVVLAERLRPDAADTLEFFRREGVIVKVISGDHAATVGAVSGRVGVLGADDPVDARGLPEDLDDLGEALERSSVFGRVQPHQKRAMVWALQRRGHVVAMTGDGVNDVLALKEADLGVAMGSGSDATRAVAQVVLLDSSFAALPAVLAEGRRVIANIERVANLFVTKSVYAFLLAVAVGIAGVPFPFLPRHLTIVSSLTIGIPAFFLALAPNAQRAHPGFVGRVARFALPAGTVAATATFAGYATAGTLLGETLAQERTAALMILFLVSMWVLFILARPVNGWRTALLSAMGATFVAVLALPATREFFELSLPSTRAGATIAVVTGAAVVLLEAGWRLSSRWSATSPRPPGSG